MARGDISLLPARRDRDRFTHRFGRFFLCGAALMAYTDMFDIAGMAKLWLTARTVSPYWHSFCLAGEVHERGRLSKQVSTCR